MKIFYSDEYIPGFCIARNNSLCFDIEKDKWIFVDSIEKSEVIPLQLRIGKELDAQYKSLIDLGYTNQWILFLDIFHLDERVNHFYEEIIQFYKTKNINKILFVHSNKAIDFGIYYDFMFNRQKSYIQDFDTIVKGGRIYSYQADKSCYELASIKNDFTSNHYYLCPNRIYDWDHYRFAYRKRLKNHLDSQDVKGFISNPPHKILEPQQSSLLEFMKQDQYGGGGTWFPIHNKYYQQSYFSVYVETITVNYDEKINLRYSYRAITEKTFDPLMKGHFILPFGYQGFIKDVLDYGFKLPSFIDYSYDLIENNEERFLSFLRSLDKLLAFSPADWQYCYKKHMETLEYNRQLFFDKSYDSLYDKVKNKINTL